MEQDKCFFCQTQNQVEQCDKCPMIYCAKHQVIHKPEKLNRCLPFVVDFVENVGRVLRAAKIIKKGEVVMFDGAFTMGNINIAARCRLNLLPMHGHTVTARRLKLTSCKTRHIL